jgi:hypothetical protein
MSGNDGVISDGRGRGRGRERERGHEVNVIKMGVSDGLHYRSSMMRKRKMKQKMKYKMKQKMKEKMSQKQNS